MSGKSRALDLVGQRFGRLVVTERVLGTVGATRWKCACDCGKTTEVRSDALRQGRTRSCGCLLSEATRERLTKHGYSRHVGATPTYNSWQSMIQRCTNPKAAGFRHYGGRGIKVCDQWRKFENFLADMGERPDSTELDRVDVDGDYGPENCRWVTRQQQCRNTRRTPILTHEGVTRTLMDWAEHLGVSPDVLRSRMRRGWPVERILSPEISARGGPRFRVAAPMTLD